MNESNIAYLSSKGAYTFFSFRNRIITFLTSKNLERYTSIKEWDHGYLVVEAQRSGADSVEDYIDLIPILEHLNINPQQFLNPIKEVRLNYA